MKPSHNNTSILVALAILVLGCCPAAWAQQKQGGVVKIKQIYLMNDDPSPTASLRKAFFLKQCDEDLKKAQEIWKQVGINIQRVEKPTIMAEVGEITVASAHLWAWEEGMGDIVPIVYIDSFGSMASQLFNPTKISYGHTRPEFVEGAHRASIVMLHRYGLNGSGLFNYVDHLQNFYDPQNELQTATDTLAHEIGHLLLNDATFATSLLSGNGPHHLKSTYANHLMADGEFAQEQSKRIIEFLPMTRNGKYLNQVEAIYTASSYVTAKTPGFPAQMYISLDFINNGGTVITTDDRRFSGGFLSNSRAGSTPSFISQVGGRFIGPPAYGSTEIRNIRSSMVETSDPNVPFAISIYERTVDGGANVESSYEFIITPDASTPVNKLTIPPGFTDTNSPGCSIQAYRYPQTPITDVVVEVISATGNTTTLTPGTDYQMLASYPALQLGRVNALMLGSGTAVLRIRAKTPSTEPASTRGDLNSDGVVNNADITLLYARMGQTSTTYDLNGDGQVSLGDALELVGLLPGALLGDLNFDGVVNAADLAALNGGWGTAAGRSGGDIDGDGLVTEVDLMLMAGDWQAPPATSHGVLLARPQDRIATPFSRQSVPVWDVRWTASAGVSYQLETSSNLLSWTSIGSPLTGAGNPVRRLVEMPMIGKQGFVRLKGADARQSGFAGSPQFDADRLTWAAQAGQIFTIENWAPLDAVSTNGFWLPAATVQVVTNGKQNLVVPAVDDLGHGKRFRVLRAASP